MVAWVMIRRREVVEKVSWGGSVLVVSRSVVACWVSWRGWGVGRAGGGGGVGTALTCGLVGVRGAAGRARWVVLMSWGWMCRSFSEVGGCVWAWRWRPRQKGSRPQWAVWLWLG